MGGFPADGGMAPHWIAFYAMIYIFSLHPEEIQRENNIYLNRIYIF